MGASVGGSSKTQQTTEAPLPSALPTDPADDAEAQQRIEEARQRELKRRRLQAQSTVSTSASGDLGSASVGRKTLG